MRDPKLAPFTVATARPNELERAFQLIFEPINAADRRLRELNAVEMTRQGELDPSGVMVARRGRELIGAMIAVSAAGACGLVWPPMVTDIGAREAVEDRLVERATAWLREHRTKFAQTLIAEEENRQSVALLRNGFTHITDLVYMRHDLAMLDMQPPGGLRLDYRDFGTGAPDVFLETLHRTYEDADDCPEINGVRSMDEIIAGHKAQGKHDPRRWWLALDHDRPLGVLLLTEFIDAPIWDLTYIGVLPEHRRKGIGRELVQKAIREVRSAGGLELTLAVDERNVSAIRLYQNMGFEAVEKRHVYLAIWPTGR